MDQNGNIALNYSRSDTTLHPQAAITGRLAGDPLNTMGAEAIWYAGAGSQVNTSSRWGDYTSIFLDTDDCTFWAINEYYATTTNFQFNTRIGSFKFAGCTSGPTGILEGTVTDGSSPIPGATVTAGVASTTTNAAGHYQFTLPPGDYDMTASKFGYSSDSANAVPVTDGGDTVQDFELAPGVMVAVNGVVKDGSGEGWPLYAKIVITAPGYPGATLYTDPVTGYYGITLVESNYNFAVTAVSAGYHPGGGPVTVSATAKNDPGGQVVNWSLLVDSPTCIAPGYGPPVGVVFENFESGGIPSGWTLQTNSGNPWSVTTSIPCEGLGNLTGGTGAFALADGLCDYLNFNVFDDNELITPSVDMSAAVSPIIRWNNDFAQSIYYFNTTQTVDVDISTNGGSSWTNVWERTTSERGPGVQTVDISGVAAGQANVKARFHYQANPDDFWAWWWQVDNVFLGQAGTPCSLQPGGLVTGFVKDSNTGLGINGATVTNLPADGSTKTFAANAGAGFYMLFAASGSQPFEASQAKYISQDKSTVVVPNSTVGLDFSLDAGKFDMSPTPISSKVDPGATDTQPMTITNSGTGEGHFEVIEINSALKSAPAGPFASAEARRQALKRIAKAKGSFLAKSGKGLPANPNAPPPGRPLAAGDVLASFPTSIPYGWGVGFDTNANDFWVSNIGAYGGGDKDYRYLTDGTLTGDTIDDPWVGAFVADGAFNTRTGMIWNVNVGGDNCIYELDPIAKVSTGNKICPSFGTSERGLAYDGETDTYYSGSWNDFTINHFDSDGTILDSKNVGLGISGLAYFPGTGHLFVQVSNPSDFAITVLDAKNGYAVVGSFHVSDGAFDDHGGAGMDADCEGNLWMVNQSSQKIFKVASGEEGSCGSDIPWLSEDPTEGTVSGSGGGGGGKPTGTQPVAVTFDSTSLFPGLRQAQLKLKTDTPYQVSPVGINFTVRFWDVLDNVPVGTDPYENSIYSAAGANIMHGCAFYYFCPSDLVTRADMAGYIERSCVPGLGGPGNCAFTPPPVYTGIFSDVFFGDYNADYIQGIYDDGVTAGCQGPGQPLAFCPNSPISRGQMAVFIEKGWYGSTFIPVDCANYFTDVPCPPTPAAPYGNWIQQLFDDGITVGCNLPGQPGYPLFCPDQSIPNEQMAVFLVKRWGFPVLP
jgi:Carboxypeptidase regulatory-like domain